MGLMSPLGPEVRFFPEVQGSAGCGKFMLCIRARL
jgi:hypothetical protein